MLLFLCLGHSAWWQERMSQHALSDLLDDKGMISRDDAKKLQRRSHVNILLTYTSDELKGNLTGKVYEYIAANRPIIAIINGPYDEEMQRTLSHPDFLVGSMFEEGFEQRVYAYLKTRILEWNTTKDVSFTPDQELIDRFSWPSLVKIFVPHIFTDK